MTKQKTTSASTKKAKSRRRCSAEPKGGASRNGRSTTRAQAKKQSTASRRPCPVEQTRTEEPKASKSQDRRQPKRILEDRRLLRLARFPEQEPGVTLDYLFEQTSRRSVESVWESVTILTALEYLAEVTLSDGSTGFALTELAVEKEKLLPADEISLVRPPSEATVMRADQVIALSGRSESEAQALLSSLVRRGFLSEEQDSSVEGLVICPTLSGLAEAGFNRRYYQTRPANREWPHTLKVNDVRIALVDEFVPKDSWGHREWGNWQWVSERMRSRVVSRSEKHMADGFWVHGRDFSLAVEVARSTPEGDQLLATMEELSREHDEARYYPDNELARNKIVWAMEKLKLGNVNLMEMPGPAVYQS